MPTATLPRLIHATSSFFKPGAVSLAPGCELQGYVCQAILDGME